MKKINIFFFILIFLSSASISQGQTQKGLDINGEAALDESGFSVSMPDANTVAIGAKDNDGNGTNSGHVRVYSWNNSAWIQKGADINGEAASDFSGNAVSMPDANTLAIGAYENDGNGVGAGHVRVFNWNGTIWAQKGMDIDGEAAGDYSGWSVSMGNANTVAIGAFLNDGNGNNAGHVRVYSWNGSAWIQKGLDINGEAIYDQSGHSVSMPDANTVAIGAKNNNGSGSYAGHVRIYSWNGLAWVQKGLDIDGEVAWDYSGYSVSMPDANTVAIGAINNNLSTGQVRIYSWNGIAWVQKGEDIDGEAASDESGFSVSMPDANTVAIGARLNNGNGNDAGHVRVYSWNGTLWVQNGSDINGEAAINYSGYAVSMPDSNTVAIGAYRNNGSSSLAGHVRIFNNFPIVLPVDLMTFNGERKHDVNELTWTTSSEQNNAYFNLQYSTNGIDFKTIAKVNSQAPSGNSQTELNYSFEHTKPNLGHNYYRLEQVDIDNNSRFNDEVIDLMWGNNGSSIQLYPNPTLEILNIDLYTTNVQYTIVNVLDLSGRIVKQLKKRNEVGMNTLSINLSELNSGLYIIQVYGNDKLSHVSKIKKN
jgi:hypothetical protein